MSSSSGHIFIHNVPTGSGSNIIDLTDDSAFVEPVSSSSKASLKVWRERHRREPSVSAQAGPSTSSGAVRQGSRSRTGINGDNLDVSMEIVEIDVSPDSSSNRRKESRKKRRRASHEVPPEPKKVAPPPPPPEPPAYRCPVCLDTNREFRERNENMMVILCGHILCKPCSLVVKDNCPVCRKKIKKNGIISLYLT